MEEIKTTYYPHVDGLKGFAILLMVMAHALAWSYTDYSFLTNKFAEMSSICEFNASFLWKLIYSFHMPLLFAVSGFLFFKPQDYNWERTGVILQKRITRILIPYLVTGVFVVFLKGYFGYWFLQVLFILNCILALELMLLYYVKASVRMEFFLYLLVYCMLFVGCKMIGRLSLPMEYNNISGLDGYYLAFLAGYLLRKYPNVDKYISMDKYSAVTFVLFITLFSLNNSNIHIPYIGTFAPISAMAFLWSSFKKVNYKTCGGEVLTLIGRNSLEIYILHLFFVMPFHEVGTYILVQKNFAMSITLQVIYSFTISSIAIVLSIGVANILKKNKILSKIMFGV